MTQSYKDSCRVSFSGAGLVPDSSITYEYPGPPPRVFAAVDPYGYFNAEVDITADGSTITFTAMGSDGKPITSTITLS